MDDLSLSARIAISLLIVASIFSIMMTLIGVTQEAKRHVVGTIEDAAAYSYSADMDTLSEADGSLPVATIYVALTRNSDVIQSISGTVQGKTISQANDLTALFSYKARIKVNLVGDKIYSVLLSDE